MITVSIGDVIYGAFCIGAFVSVALLAYCVWPLPGVIVEDEHRITLTEYERFRCG